MKRLLSIAAGLLLSGSVLAQSLSLHTPAQAPASSVAVADASVVGTRFSSNVDGTIVALRFYKSSGDASTHTLSLWKSTGASSGTLIWSGTTSSETSSGWQTLYLTTSGTPSPVRIRAGDEWIVGVHRPGGSVYPISYTNTAFQTSDLINPPLIAKKLVNGVYAQPAGSTTTFPASVSPTYIDYFVDVVFVPGYCGVFQ